MTFELKLVLNLNLDIFLFFQITIFFDQIIIKIDD